MGYSRAGFRIVGVDKWPQPRYPFEFVQGDAFTVLEKYGASFDIIHASPPCQAYTRARSIQKGTHRDYVPELREWLLSLGKPYVIENVEGAPLIKPIVLCGSMFGLGVYRHRLFECSLPVRAPAHPPHRGKVAPLGYAVEGQRMTVAGHFINLPYASKCMGIDWMNREELAEAIPPAYTEYIGHQLMEQL
jgi:DNA (cytosine-5)-methyltransferase 1